MNFQWTIPAIDEETRRRKQVRLLVLGLLAVFLVWEITTRGLAAYLAETDPEAALTLDPGNSVALLNLIDTKLDEVRDNAVEPSSAPKTATHGGSDQRRQTSTTFYPTGLDRKSEAQIRSWAELALRNDPLNAEALRVLGQLSDLTHNNDQTRQLMQAAVRRSLRESIAVSYMMEENYLKQDYGAALRYADVLLRTRPQFIGQAMPVLGRIAESQDGSQKLKNLLATNPPWRGQFLASLPGVITDARTPLDLLLSLKDTPAPPTAADCRAYIDFLISHGFYDLAYYTWLQFLPAEQLSHAGRLFNGRFESEPSGAPFDWRFTQGNGAATKIAARPDHGGDHALYMQFGPGRAEFPGVSELVMLPPGSYKLEGQYKMDLTSPRGLKWRVTCAKQTAPLAESPLFKGRIPDWTGFGLAFSVPATNCPAQTVQLVSGARSASEQFMFGSAWYDDLAIVSDHGPMPSEPAPSPNARTETAR